MCKRSTLWYSVFVNDGDVSYGKIKGERPSLYIPSIEGGCRFFPLPGKVAGAGLIALCKTLPTKPASVL